MNYSRIKEHYLKNDVANEIIEYSRDRWIGIHCMERDEKGKQIFHRYINKVPIQINSLNDLKYIFETFSDCKPRTFYASINKYHSISDRDSLYLLDNIYAVSPVWDIDNRIEYWQATVEVAKSTVDILRDYGIKYGLFIKWSGEGVHIHLHENIFSEDVIRDIHPIDIAYSVVEYIMGKVMDSVDRVRREYNIDTIKVENKVDISRVFTVPLSLHRELDRVAVCVKPDKLNIFDISWTDPSNYRHDVRWREYKVGEGDDLAYKAYEAVGGYPYRIRRRRKTKPVDSMIKRWLNEGEL